MEEVCFMCTFPRWPACCKVGIYKLGWGVYMNGVCIRIKVDRKLDKIDLHLVKINFKILVHTATQKK